LSITAVISDFGGVLTTPLIQSFMAFQDRTGVSMETLGQTMQEIAEADGEHPLYELERGNTTEVDFLERMADQLEYALGHRPEMHRFSETYFDALQPNPPMIELMRELKDDGYRMALLTNNVREWEPTWRSMLPVDEIFELVVDSAFVGCRKPEPRIYEITLERLGLPGSACLFVDDVADNCEGARALGMTAVRFVDAKQAIRELEDAISRNERADRAGGS
jgi:putative hydrolase of the HAD superfamily